MRTEFDDAIGVVPPSGIDVDELIGRGRRRARRRRLGVVVSTIVAATAAIAVVVPLVNGAPRGDQPLSAGSSTAPVELPADVEARLSHSLGLAVRKVAPDVQESGDTFSPVPLAVKHVARKASRAPDGTTTVPDDFYATSATLTDSAGAGNLFVTFARADAAPASGMPDLPAVDTSCPSVVANEVSCQVVTGPHGERVVQREIHGEGQKRTFRVSMTKVDGTRVILTAANDGGQAATGPVTRPAPVLSVAQLMAIGTEPGLTVPV
jgi:hypothetical protein